MRAAIALAAMMLCGAALGATKAPEDDELKGFVPAAKLKCAPLYEVLDMKLAIYRGKPKEDGSPTAKLVLTLRFVQHARDVSRLAVTAAFGECCGGTGRTTVLLKNVKREVPVTTRVVADMPGFVTTTDYTRFANHPHVTFEINPERAAPEE